MAGRMDAAALENNQPKPKHGGARPGGGRPKGVPNKATRELREIAREYVPSAMIELDRLSRKAESEAARVAAIKEILDRAYGKSPQAMTGPGGEGPMQVVVLTGVPRDAAGG